MALPPGNLARQTLVVVVEQDLLVMLADQWQTVLTDIRSELLAVPGAPA
jgi:hypothetical protein